MVQIIADRYEERVTQIMEHRSLCMYIICARVLGGRIWDLLDVHQKAI